VHSLAMDGGFWDPVVKVLARDAAVLTYDCRGHAASEAGTKAFRRFAVAEAITYLTQALEIATRLPDTPARPM